MKTCKYEWIGETRMIPNIGEPKSGEVLSLEETLGDSLVAQGLCVKIVAKAPATKKEV